MSTNKSVSNYVKIRYISRTPGNSWESGKHDVAPSGRRPIIVERGATFRLDVLNARGEIILANREYSIGSGLTHDGNGQEIAPDIEDVMHAFLSEADTANGTFQDFCDNLGYDADSRKALESYLECQETHNALMRGFSTQELSELRELLEDY